MAPLAPMRREICLILLLLLACAPELANGLLPLSGSPEFGSVWLQRGYDAARSGRTPHSLGPASKAALRVKWVLPVSGMTCEAYPAVDDQSHLVVGAIASKFYMINAIAGTLNYTLTFTDKTLGSPCLE